MISAFDIHEALYRLDGTVSKPTEEQAAIISAPLTPSIVVAGAGSGKTETMAARTLWLIANGYMEPGEILGLTFTRKAAGELLARVRTRLRQLERAGLIKPSEQEPTILTYHAYAGRLASEYGLRKGIEPDLTALGEAATWQLAWQVVTNFEEMPIDLIRELDKGPSVITEDVILLSKLIAEHGTSIEKVAELSSELISHIGSLAGKLNQDVLSIADIAKLRLAELPIVERFNERRLTEGLLTFDDQMSLAATLASEFPDIAESERSKYKAVLLDEYQDTSQSQLRLLSSLYGDGHCVMAVGDPLQSIYGWRGASADTMETFYKYFPSRAEDQRRFSLSVSWRNDQKILDLSNELIDLINNHRGEEALVDRLSARSGAGEGVVLTGSYLSRDGEGEALADYFASRINSEVSAAVLVRTRSQIEFIERALRLRQVPVEVVGVGGLLYLPEIVEIISLLKTVAFTDRGAALMRLLAGPRYALSPRDIKGLSRYAKDLSIAAASGVRNSLINQIAQGDTDIVENEGSLFGNIIDALDQISDAPRGYFTDPGWQRLNQASREISQMRRKSGSLIDITLEAIRLLGLEFELLVRDGIAQGARQLYRFLDEVSQFQSQGGTLVEFLQWIDQAMKSERGLKQSEVKVSKGVVQILTIHSAKGLEWDLVAVPGLSEKHFPNVGKGVENWLKDAGHIPFALRGDSDQLPHFDFYRSESAKNLKDIKEGFDEQCRNRNYLEELRLGYVAFTRARREIFLTFPYFHEGANQRGPSALYEIATNHGQDISKSISEEELLQNPQETSPKEGRWPEDRLKERRANFNKAIQLFEGAPELSDEGVKELNPDIYALLLQERERKAKQIVYLPSRISVSTLQSLIQSPEELALRIRRPLPSNTNSYARRGSAFHSWVERHLKSPQLLSDDEIEFDENLLDDQLESLKKSWLKSSWAERVPVEVELPFELVVDGVLIRGRIDAVYESSSGFEVVDWKSGKARSGEELKQASMQLAAYRIAFAQLRNIELSQVSAAFHYVSEDETLRPVDLLTRDEIIQLLPKWDDDR